MSVFELDSDDVDALLNPQEEFAAFADRGRIARRNRVTSPTEAINPTQSSVTSQSSSAAAASRTPTRIFTRIATNSQTTPSASQSSAAPADRTPIGIRNNNAGVENVYSLFKDEITQDATGAYVKFVCADTRSTADKARAMAVLVAELMTEEKTMDEGPKLKKHLREEFIFFRLKDKPEKLEVYRTCKDPHHAQGITFDVKQSTTDAGYVVNAVKHFMGLQLEYDFNDVITYCAGLIEENLAKLRARKRKNPQSDNESEPEAEESGDDEAGEGAVATRRLRSLQSVMTSIKTLGENRILLLENAELLDHVDTSQDISTFTMKVNTRYLQKLQRAINTVYPPTVE
jgi:hypothetical protein